MNEGIATILIILVLGLLIDIEKSFYHRNVLTIPFLCWKQMELALSQYQYSSFYSFKDYFRWFNRYDSRLNPEIVKFCKDKADYNRIALMIVLNSAGKGLEHSNELMPDAFLAFLAVENDRLDNCSQQILKTQTYKRAAEAFCSWSDYSENEFFKLMAKGFIEKGIVKAGD